MKILVNKVKSVIFKFFLKAHKVFLSNREDF